MYASRDILQPVGQIAARRDYILPAALGSARRFRDNRPRFAANAVIDTISIP